MSIKRILGASLAIVLAAGCSTAATPSPSPSSAAPTTQATASASASASAAASASASASPLAVDPAEAVIPNVEQGATITFWTFYLSPTFDNYIKETIARFEATYPGVTVNWEDHQATFKDDLNAAFAAGK